MLISSAYTESVLRVKPRMPPALTWPCLGLVPFVMDNAFTATPDVNSTLIGRAQGLYAMSSQENNPSLLMTLTYNFVTGIYNGSSLSIVGRNPIMNEVREMPVVGGTGIFRLARGFALAKTYSMNQADAIIGYNVTVIPYY